MLLEGTRRAGRLSRAAPASKRASPRGIWRYLCDDRPTTACRGKPMGTATQFRSTIGMIKSIATQFRSTIGMIKTVGAALALAGLVTGCSVAAVSPSASQASPSAADSSSPSAVASAWAASSSSEAPATTGPAPSGTWSSLKWTDQHTVFPQTPTPSTGDGGTQNSLFGWSKGYIDRKSVV